MRERERKRERLRAIREVKPQLEPFEPHTNTVKPVSSLAFLSLSMARTYIYININHVGWPNSWQKSGAEKENRNWFGLCISGGRISATYKCVQCVYSATPRRCWRHKLKVSWQNETK